MTNVCLKLENSVEADLANINRHMATLLSAIVRENDFGSLSPTYIKWLETSREMLKEGEAAEVSQAQGWHDWDVAKGQWLAKKELAPQVRLVEACLKAIPDVLSGRIDAHEILFPDGSMDLVQSVHRGNTVADYFNRVLCEKVETYVKQRVAFDPATKIRILEVGGGVGGTTADVLQRLNPYFDNISEYCFTDLSQAFLDPAQQRFKAAHPYFSTGILNIDQETLGQGFEPDSYDVIIAANVLHVATDIRTTLQGLKNLLHSRGLLFINEISKRSLFTHLTFGLLDAWWAYEDASIRISGCPGLLPHMWENILKQEGFPHVLFPASLDHERGQQVLIAESDGVVRRKRSKAGKPPVSTSDVSRQRMETEKVTVSKARQDECRHQVTKIVSDVLKVPEGRLNPLKPLKVYGLDSILAIQLTKAMREVCPAIKTTTFFEAETIDALVGFITQNDSQAVLSFPDNKKPVIPAKKETSPKGKGGGGKAGQEDIAIIGVSGRFPGCDDLESFWEKLLAGQDLVSEIPTERWSSSPRSDRCQWGGFLNDVGAFDPLFFGISPREAEVIAPEERLFLETVWNLLETACITRESISEKYQNSVGVYAGAMYQHYRELTHDDALKAMASLSSFSAIANRVSHYFDFQGPSMAVDTMCSASAVAMHMACESLKKGECKLAIAGGVNLSLYSGKFAGLSEAQLVASTPESRSFTDGDGYLPAEAVGAVLLKPLDRAREDNDQILGVIRASAINHDGHTLNQAMPNANAQQQLIVQNFLGAGIDPQTVDYVEAAANGSALGDAIEFDALTQAFRHFTQEESFCVLGSVKSNMGHPEAASGIAQLTKVLLQMRYGKIVPSIKAQPLNPEINLSASPFAMQSQAIEWPKRRASDGTQLPKRATVSSFGGGGTNAHFIIDEYMGHVDEGDLVAGPWPIVLSARTISALRGAVENLLTFLETNKDIRLDRVSRTLLVGREAMEERLALVVASGEELLLGLRDFLQDTSSSVPLYQGSADLDVPAGHNTGTTLEMQASGWVKGQETEWSIFWGGTPPAFLELPTYPFERQLCWLPTNVQAQGIASHSYDFSGQEPYVTDHKGVLPAVAAVDLVLGSMVQREDRVALSRIVWDRPMSYVAEDNSFHVNSQIENGVEKFYVSNEKRDIYCRGQVELGHADQRQTPDALSLDTIFSETPQSLNREACNALLCHSNGPSLFTIDHVRYGDEDMLARVGMSKVAGPGGLDYGVLNSLVLTCVLWHQLQNPDSPLPQPYTLEECCFYGSLPESGFVHVRKTKSPQTSFSKFDAYLVDMTGNVRLVFRGFTAALPNDFMHEGMDKQETLGGDGVNDDVLQELASMLSSIQKIETDRLNPKANWSRFGMSSIGFTELTEGINKRYGLDLMPTVFFEHPTLNSMAAFLSSKLGLAATLERHSHRLPSKQEGHASIAIVGVSARLPGAENLEALWEHLVNNRDLISEVPKSRWDWREMYGDPHQEQGKTRAKWGGFISNVDCFDPFFFDLSPRDAEGMDPQARLVMEASWAALEDAGYAASALAGSRTGVFVGVSTADYKDICRDVEPALSAHIKPFLIANRVSYFLDLHGPSEIIDTACSSSLVAIHRAVESIRQGNCDAALVGGVNVIASPEITLSLSRSGVLSEDGRCMAFDRRANGMVRGEGVGMIMLKPLADAEKAGDRIYGIIRGTAENHDGRSSSASAPNPKAQSDLIVQAMAQGEIEPETMGYIEAHGTGTELGDPIEIKGLRNAYAALSKNVEASEEQQPYCATGTIKANIGHLEAAAGIAGLLKVLLMFKHEKIPGNPHLREPNPYLELEGGPFYLAKETTEWPEGRFPRRAGVSSFGIGGGNAHVVLEAYRSPRHKEEETISIQPVLVPISARDEEGLSRVVSQLAHFVETNPSVSKEDLAYTLQVGREAFDSRLIFSARSMAEISTMLEEFLSREVGLSGAVKLTIGSIEQRELAERWVDGESVDWNRLYQEGTPNRIALPTYPFSRKRYWVTKAPETAIAQGTADDVAALEGEQAHRLEAGEGTPILCRPVWQDCEIEENPQSISIEKLVFFCGRYSTPTDMQNGERHIASVETDLAGWFEKTALSLFEHIQKILESRPKNEVLVQVIIDAEGDGVLLSGLHGLLRSAMKENSRLKAQLIEIEKGVSDETVRERLLANQSMLEDVHIRYEAGYRKRLIWQELSVARDTPETLWKERGVYLITGGMGGLGPVFAEEIIRNCIKPIVILVGRSRINSDGVETLNSLQSMGADVRYWQADVSQQGQVDHLVANIKKKWSGINGILHCAGINRGRYILKKTASEFQSVLAPKVSGTVYLDNATRAMNLDFFVLFASGAGAIGHPAQADYATANGFLDSFAQWRSHQVLNKARSGMSLAIDWPLWKTGGMRLAQDDQKDLKDAAGMIALKTGHGVRAFHTCMAQGLPQIGVVSGDYDVLRKTFFSDQKAGDDKPVDHVSPTLETALSLYPVVRSKMKNLIAEQVKMSAEDVELDKALEAYGIDSIAIKDLNEKLEGIFGPTPKTLLFEVRTIQELADYFVDEYADESASWCGVITHSVEREKESRIDADDTGHRPWNKGNHDDPIAIIGMAGCFPDAPDLETFWQNLEAGKDSIKELPTDRWALKGFFEPDPEKAIAEGKSYSKWGGFIESIFDFDPQFFGISPREALVMDPQERLFLQAAWSAFEDAGYSKESLKETIDSRVGVFVGITKTGYDLYGPELWRAGDHIYPHTSFGSVANRVSYSLDLKGPSMPIDTLCSASLTALHEARTHILRGDCDMALVGGVNLYLHPSSYTSLCAYGFLAQSQRCKSFGKGGDGFIPGEGVGAIVLKRLSQAERDGDAILATIEGSSINHDGKTNGYTVPNPKAQADLIRSALNHAGINARDISYVEAHGTGTDLGDPIEVRGLSLAFSDDTKDTNFAALGSLKSNIGHLEAAAGIAGVIKLLLQMKHGKLVPSLHATELNPNIDFSSTPFWVQRELQDWENEEKIAAISSFGAGGSNAHAILKAYDKPAQLVDKGDETSPEAIVLSAKDEAHLDEKIEHLLSFLEKGKFNVSDLAHTLQVGRSSMDYRLGFVVHSHEELIDVLARYRAQKAVDGIVKGRVSKKIKTLADMVGEEAAKKVVSEWLQKDDLTNLLDQWVAGYPVPWLELRRERLPQKMSLPVYPFARETYRLERPSVESTVPQMRDVNDVYCFREIWKETRLPSEQKEVDAVLCYVAPTINCDQVAQRAKENGFKQVICRPIPASHDWLDLEHDLADVRHLLFIANGQAEDSYKIASLLKALRRLKQVPERLVFAGQYENRTERAHIESWIGFERSLRLVMPDTEVSVIATDTSLSFPARMSILAAEVRSPKAGGVLYGGGLRQEPSFEPYVPPASQLDVTGNIIITGGCGGLGYLAAKHLSSIEGVNLILTGRSALSSEIKAKLKGLEKQGAGVFYLQADVCDRQAMETGLSEVRKKFGSINGLVHAAGVEARGSIFENTQDDFQRVTGAKVQGTLVLDELLSHEPLQFVSYFSSSAAILGDFGSCDYSVANRFLMAFGEGHPNGNHVINWPLWRDGGMGQGPAQQSELYLETSGQRLLESDEGFALFDRILAGEAGSTLVLAGKASSVTRFLSKIARPFKRKDEDIEARLMVIAGKLLGLSADRFDNDRSFSEFGFDSISLADFAKSLTREFKADIAPAVLYGHPTFESLAEFLKDAGQENVRTDSEDISPLSVKPMKISIASRQPKRVLRAPVAKNIEEPIAIIGMSGRFPGASDVKEFWQNFKSGKTAISPFPESRASLDESLYGAFIDGIDDFDPLFFGMPPMEAEKLDPRQRVFMETAWHALEDAGAMGKRIRGSSCGVYVGVEEGLPMAFGENGDLTSSQNATLAARLSYMLDLKGPSMALTTACSSALVALHQACMGLRHGDCELALVGGINLILTSEGYANLKVAGMLSSDDQCRVFSQEGDGLVPGEAVVAVVLKPLSAALRDGDPVYANITASGINYDGKTNGISAPNPLRQAELIETLYDRIGFDPATLQLVMAHSIGAQVSDAIEVEALTNAFSKYTNKRDFCALRSIKPLIGHTFAASGLVSLVAAVMSLKTKEIPGLPQSGKLNETINHSQCPFNFSADNQEWVKPEKAPRRAALGATGISGTNAHVLLEEYVPSEQIHQPSPSGPWLFPFSAKTPERLKSLVSNMLDYLARQDCLDLAAVSHMLIEGREGMKYRIAVTAHSDEDLLTALRSFLAGEDTHKAVSQGKALKEKKERERATSEIKEAIQSRNMPDLAALWCLGADISWHDLYHSPGPRMLSLPGYPFEKRKMGKPSDQKVGEKTVQEEKVAELYRTIAELERPEFREGFLTFFPLLEKRPDFSITRIGLHPEDHPEEVALVHAKQQESRKVLFHGTDFGTVESLIDFGCGYGTDVINLVKKHEGLHADGYTITPAQAQIAQDRIVREGVEGRARVFNLDSTKDPFPQQYDVALGVEVTCHIKNKDSLFENILAALRPEGRILLMDFVANMRGGIVDHSISVYIPTQEEWIDLITRHGLMLEQSVDLSTQIANSIDDQEYEENIKGLPKVLADSWRNWINNTVAIDRGWVGYRLFKMKRATTWDTESLRRHNKACFDAPTLYPEALMSMLSGEKWQPKAVFSGNEKGAQEQKKTQVSVKRQSRSEVLPRLIAVFENVLKLGENDLRMVDSIQELGLDSLNAVALLEAINSEFYLTLPTSVVFEFATIEELAAYIVPLLPNDLGGDPAETRERAENPPVSLVTGGQLDNKNNLDVSTNATIKASDIAIVGLSCRCAGAGDMEELWSLVSEGREAISTVSDPEWLDYLTRYSEKEISLRYGAMADIDKFDPLFFRISPKEADAMGVSQRLLLEECYHALENAGYAPTGLSDFSVGTYIGLSSGVDPEEPDHSHLAMLGLDTSIAAARIAYLLDLKGPALAINTACSSSLVAIDLAVKALQNGDVDMALAGGITIWDHPAPFVSMNNAGMLSPTGECRPFDSGANGIIVGDGVGIVVLKRLEDAVAEGDAIRAVIKGSGTNQDGRTTGITVPSFLSQSKLLSSIYEQAGAVADDIQYVEAHGTATKLGDPIEIHALTDSFSKTSREKAFCAIGSLKANIGHTAAASGVMGLIKLVSALEHGQMPPSIHYAHPNEHIDFENSPVYVNLNLAEWPKNKAGKRLAALSSFGYSGTNAHLLVESGNEVDRQCEQPHKGVSDTFLIVLSARTSDRLKALADMLHAFVSERQNSLSLASLAYTLQIGRDAMEERVAFEVSSVDDVLRGLSLVTEGSSFKPCWRGHCDDNDGFKTLLLDDEDAEQLITRWLAKGRLSKLAELWVAGYGLEWRALYGGVTPTRIPLPGYPFSKRACRIPSVGTRHTSLNGQLHPLLHQNTSDLSGVSYLSKFNGNEAFFRDHQVAGQKMLPGTAYLEMAVSALFYAVKKDIKTMLLQDILWVRPIIADEHVTTVHTSIKAHDTGKIQFEIASGREGSEIAVRGAARPDCAEQAPALDLERLIHTTSETLLSGDDCYKIFSGAGVEFGVSHRVIEHVRVGSSCVLARLKLPKQFRAGVEGYRLHPGLLDGAFQATVGFVYQQASSQKTARPMLPFALAELHLINEMPDDVWVFIRPSKASGKLDLVLDLDICNDKGEICVRLKGLTARYLDDGSEKKQDVSNAKDTPVLYSVPKWANKTAADDLVTHDVFDKRIVASIGFPEVELDSSDKSLQILQFTIDKKIPWGEWVHKTAGSLFSIIKETVGLRHKGKTLFQLVVPSSGDAHVLAGLSGLMKTTQMECPSFCGQVLELPNTMTSGDIEAILKQEVLHSKDQNIRYQDGERQVLQWYEPEAIEALSWDWKKGGVYLITGGFGGLGLLMASEIVARVQDVTLVLVGRSSPSAAVRQKISDFEKAGATVDCQHVNVADCDEVVSLIEKLYELYGRVTGVIHTAGVIRDGIIRNKTLETFNEVLEPKVSGVFNLDSAIGDKELDFFVTFSSGAGIWGNSGQADYSTANAIMDQFIVYRQQMVQHGGRYGRSISINWPLWRDGGMRVGARVIEKMAKTIGAVPLRAENGFAAFEHILESGFTQVAVMQGDPVALRASGFGSGIVVEETETPKASQPRALQAESEQALRAWTLEYLSQLLRNTLGGNDEDYDEATDLASYGLDSVLILELNTCLEEDFPTLPQTLFFEYASLGELTQYFIDQYHDVLVGLKNRGLRHDTTTDERLLSASSPRHTPDEHRTWMRAYLCSVIKHVLGLQEEDLNDATNLMDYGLDSVLILEVNTLLEDHFPDLPQTLFFEFGNVGSLTDYFVKSHGDTIADLMMDTSQIEGNSEAVPAIPEKEKVSFEEAMPFSLDELIADMEALAVESRPKHTPLEARRDHSPFLSIAPLLEPIEGFSLARSILFPRDCNDVLKQVVQAQAEMRQVLFHGAALEKARHVVDLGCGIGADMVELAMSYKDLLVEGLTISQEDVEVANTLIGTRQLSGRVNVTLQDASSYEFTSDCDLIYSIQTMHLLGDNAAKKVLLEKINGALRAEGRLCMAEYVSTANGSLSDATLGSHSSTVTEWAELLANAGFEIEIVIDSSVEAINFLHDPELDAVLAGVDTERSRMVRKIAHQAVSLEKEWLKFCLIKAKKSSASQKSPTINLERFTKPVRYSDALAEVKEGTSPAYGSVLTDFPEFSSCGVERS